ncbi:hypothetical protein HJD07_05905 [Enterococcus faecium]|uniref:hypothetical protein n=1 Tax=Enterococcus faecium TaxID=1352 RepID=UPI001C8FAB8B|nr:hypothetical protein [Enterococcus faecium]MBY3651816.1 hypothetical protein [Enterococcus faecium]
MLFTLLGYLCLVLAFFGAIAIFVGQFQENNPIMRNIGIGIVIISLIVFGATKIFGSNDQQFGIFGVDNSYAPDSLGRVVIDGTFENVTSYKNVSLTVKEDDKKASDDVLATIKPSQSQFEVFYTVKENNPVRKLTLVFNVDGEEYYKDVKINKASTKKIVESAKKEVATEESTTESSSTVEVELPDKIDFDPEKVKSFESVSGSMADRFNTEVFKAIKTVKLDTEKQRINVTLFNAVESMDQDKKVTVARELGKRVIGLYRGTAKPDSDGSDLPVHVVYEDGKVFGDSTANEALTIKLAK